MRYCSEKACTYKILNSACLVYLVLIITFSSTLFGIIRQEKQLIHLFFFFRNAGKFSDVLLISFLFLVHCFFSPSFITSIDLQPQNFSSYSDHQQSIAGTPHTASSVDSHRFLSKRSWIYSLKHSLFIILLTHTHTFLVFTTSCTYSSFSCSCIFCFADRIGLVLQKQRSR